MTELMSARTPAHRRLIFEEFFYLELGLELKRRKLRTRQGTAFVTNDQVREALKQILPFKPTAAQKRVLGEIVHDMRRTQPMRRLPPRRRRLRQNHRRLPGRARSHRKRLSSSAHGAHRNPRHAALPLRAQTPFRKDFTAHEAPLPHRPPHRLPRRQDQARHPAPASSAARSTWPSAPTPSSKTK